MEEGLLQAEEISTPAKEEIFEGLDTGLRSLALLERSRGVRRIVDLALRGIGVEPIPPYLGEEHKAILVSNYPSVSQTLRAVLKVGCRLPGEGFRLKGIGRPEVSTQANFVLKALGIHRLLFPVRKDEAGAFTMDRKILQEVLAYLDGPGRVLWISITGRTRGNGLLEGDLRAGTVLFSLKKGVPLVPMAIVTREHKGRPKAAKVRFGEPIDAPQIEGMDDFQKADFLVDFSKLVMCSIAELLPSGQRGDFENADDILVETKRRLGMN
jgi:hypothetical protein